jgi:hypothetical protein
VPIDMTAVDRIDLSAPGRCSIAINRIEHQRKAVQIIGASPIIRALLLLMEFLPGIPEAGNITSDKSKTPTLIVRI